MSTAEWVASVFGGIGAVTGIAGLVVAIVSARYSKRSVVEAERSADHAGASVVEARRSADEAKRMRELEEDRRREERERRHEELAPDLPGKIDAEFRSNERLGGGHGSLFGSITLPRGYRVRAEARMGDARTELSLGMVTEPARTVWFQIEPWHPDQEKPRTDEVVFRFWPPVEGADDVPVWGCGCGRPTGEGLDGPGHWERRVKVNYYRLEDSVR